MTKLPFNTSVYLEFNNWLPWPLQFFAEDKYEGVNEIFTIPFRELVLARILRLRFETSVRAGNDKKCLRLEILGCPAGSYQAIFVIALNK